MVIKRSEKEARTCEILFNKRLCYGMGNKKTFRFPNEKRLSSIISFYEQHFSSADCRINFILLKMKLFLIDFSFSREWKKLCIKGNKIILLSSSLFIKFVSYIRKILFFFCEKWAEKFIKVFFKH